MNDPIATPEAIPLETLFSMSNLCKGCGCEIAPPRWSICEPCETKANDWANAPAFVSGHNEPIAHCNPREFGDK